MLFRRVRGWWLVWGLVAGGAPVGCVGESPCHYTASCPPPEGGVEDEEEVTVSEADDTDSTDRKTDPDDTESTETDRTENSDTELVLSPSFPTSLPILPLPLPVDVEELDAGTDAGELEDFCAENNRACDRLAECSNTPDGAECGACPSGYAGDGWTGCAPTLLNLGLSSGALSPELELGLDTYDVVVPVYIQDLILTPEAVEGASVSINGATIAPGTGWASPVLKLGDNEIRILVEQDGQPSTEYSLRVTRGAAAPTYVKASNAGEEDLFGYSVALSGDGNTLAVGAMSEDSNATGVGGNQQNDDAMGSGAVYVFVRSGSSWSQQAYLKASNAGGRHWFGNSVTLSGDGNMLAVGSPGEQSWATGIGGNQEQEDAIYAGAVYVFVRSGSNWSQQAYVKASNTSAGDFFGESVSLSGDGSTLAVGAPEEDSNATGIGGDQDNYDALASGAVYVFARSGSGWSQQAYVKASNAGEEDFFGRSMALSDDGNTLAVGAPFESSNATGIGGNQGNDGAVDAGAVYVFTRSGSDWSQQAYVKASNTGEGDRFGNSVTLSGDGSTLAVGASREDSNAAGVGGDQQNDGTVDSGAVYVFVRSGSVWTQQAYVKASNPGAADYFGWPVALSGDGNVLAVGATGESSNVTGFEGVQWNDAAVDSGAVYVFLRSGGNWSQQVYIKPPNTGVEDGFGSSVTLSGDGNTLAVGAPGEDSNAVRIDGNQQNDDAQNSGAIYVYR